MKSIDINCDSGESYGNFKIGNDATIFPLITSCNIACGFHGGDPLTIQKTILLGIEHNLNLGAHPSYPDLSGFGRRKIEIEQKELIALIKYQISAVKGMVESYDKSLSYIKPHGALYNSAAVSEKEALAIVQAIKEINPALALLGLAGSLMEQVAKEHDVLFFSEAFCDRNYHNTGKLVSRKEKNAVIYEPKKAVQQVLSIVLEKKLKSVEGQWIDIDAQSICIHGDNPMALDILAAIQKAFKEKGILLEGFI